MADLVDGRYPEFNPMWAAIGQLTNAAQSDIPARSNLEYLSLGTLTDGALAATGVGCFVPIPVDVGTVVSNVSLPIGATPGGTMTHQFAAIYSGIAVPALIAQSTDTTNAAIGASAVLTYALTTPTAITAAQAPNGYVYAGVAITATTIPTAAGISTPTAVGYQWFTGSTVPKGNSPLFFAATAGAALAGTAAATIASPSAKAVAPIIVLS